MSIFAKIKDALFNRHAQAAEPAVQTASATPTSGTAPTPAPTASPAAPVTPAAGGVAAPASVDVAAIMDAAVAKSGQQLNWRTSIVDTMKALGLDSDLASRKELAQELSYTGDMQDSGAMNVWLQKALMKKLSENGGKVPSELMD